MKSAWTAAGVFALAASATLAHQGVQNPIVMARMEGMSTMADHVSVLGNMARGRAPLDPEAANAALQSLAGEATRIVELFEDPASGPAIRGPRRNLG